MHTTMSSIDAQGCRTVWQKLWLRKPKHVVLKETDDGKLVRHLTLFDLLAVGIGGTVGSGVFVLSGLIANEYAGPAVIISWLAAGVGCIFSGLSYAELASRIPSAGSSYAYTYYALGELPAFVAGWFLTLEYGVGGAAVARSWGDKVVTWWDDFGLSMWSVLRPQNNINLFAGLIQALCVLILLFGMDMGKATVNFFTCLKCFLVLFMIVIGFCLYRSSNLKPFMPYGTSGILRGATSSYFGYIGYDEVCCLAAEAKDPQRVLPLSVFGTIAGVTVLYVLSAWALVGAQHYGDIDTSSGFSQAFKDRGWEWAGEIVAVGEIITLPVVVLISFLAQPRLLYAMAEDGLVPKVLGEVNSKQNLFKGTLISGIVCTLISIFVPFTLLGDMISAGVLLSFNLTNVSLLVVRLENSSNIAQTKYLSVGFNILACISAFAWTYSDLTSAAVVLPVMFTAGTIGVAFWIYYACPEKGDRDSFFSPLTQEQNQGYRVPFLPWTPCIGIFINYGLIAQLEWSALVLIVGYITLAVVIYLLYGVNHSVGNNSYWSAFKSTFTMDELDKLLLEYDATPEVKTPAVSNPTSPDGLNSSLLRNEN